MVFESLNKFYFRGMRKPLTEFIGTFFLMLSIALAFQQNFANWIPIIVGTTLTAMIYAGGPISGAHYNPVITLAFYLRGGFSAKWIAPYIIAQILAAVLAVLATDLLLAESSLKAVEPILVSIFSVLLAEGLGTFALAFVILSVSSNPAVKGNQYYALAIGMTVIGAAYLFGAISGAMLNPAVTVGATLMGLIKASDLWLYFIAQLIGGGLAVGIFNYIVPER